MDKDTIDKIINKYGSPVYIFNSDEFIDNYNDLINSFRKIYPKYNIAYSYKTNYTPRVCQLVKELGGYAEVVSDMEYILAKKIGYKDEEIIYNGPIKGPLMEEHFLNGGIVNIDNLQEVDRICKMANENSSKKLIVGIRVNIDVGQNFISRFGIEAESSLFKEVIKKINETDNLEVSGFHCHISRARDLKAWENRIKRLIELSDKYIKKAPKFVNLGSGMFGKMEETFANQFDGPIPTYEDYAKVVAEIFNDRYGMLPDDEKPILFSEPGTTIISKYIDFLCTVDSIKKISDKNFAVLDGSVDNIGSICTIKKLPINIYRQDEKAGKYYNDIDLTGYTCLEQDVLYKEYKGELIEGDNVLFGNVGGYSNVSKPPFITPNCPMIEVDSSGNMKEIKRKETFRDVFDTYIF